MLAFIALNIFGLFYYTVPAKIHSENQLTDYAWTKRAFNSRLTEGFGIGFIDKNGYNNVDRLAENPTPDVVVIGSSHMEAFQMAKTENLAYILDAELIGVAAYSIGISGNSFLTCVKNYESVLQTMKPQYTIMEIGTVSFSGVSVESATNGVLRNVGAFATNGIIEVLSRIPYLRLLYMQLENINGGDIEIFTTNIEGQTKTTHDTELPASIEQLNALMSKITSLAAENGTTPIIFYHPHLTINPDGTATPQTDETDLSNFTAACENAGVIFLDMTDTFLYAYNNQHILPHGFFNTEISTGHLNADGHRMCAEQLVLIISGLEKDKSK